LEYGGTKRRGSDIAKALARGAQAVSIARPVMWVISQPLDRAILFEVIECLTSGKSPKLSTTC